MTRKSGKMALLQIPSYPEHLAERELEMSKDNCIENWRDVEGFEGFYQVSDQGRVKSLSRRVEMGGKFLGRKYTVKEKILRPAWDGNYYHVVLSRSGREWTLLVHRLVLESFVGSQPTGMEGCHDDGNTRNNTLINLRWDTPAHNQQDRTKHGTSLRGRRGNSWRLRKAAPEIKRMYAEGAVSQRRLAEMFGTTMVTVSSIVNGRTWKFD